MPEAVNPPATITVECPCGKRLKAPANAVGRKAKCPKCGNILIVQAPPPPPEEEIEPGFDDGALYELAANEAQHAATAEASELRCPNCARLMGPGGILCTHCGYDVRKGKVVAETQIETGAMAKAAPPKKSMLAAFGARSTSTPSSSSSKSNPWKPGAAKEKDASEPTSGNFIMGLVLGFAFALAAALVPFFVWWKADSIPFNGWLVLLVGAAAGFGVNIGYKAGTHVAGAVAGSITLLVVIATKLAVMVAYVAPVVSQKMEEVALEKDDRVVAMVTDEELKSAKLDPDIATFEQRMEAGNRANERLKKMSDKEYQKLLSAAPAYEQKKSLIPYLTDEVLKERNLKPEDASAPERKEATKEARARVEKMTASDRERKLAAAEKEATDEMKAQMEEVQEKIAKSKSKRITPSAGDDDQKSSEKNGKGSDGHSLVGFAIIMVIAFFIWAMIPTFVAMSLAWKIAADA